MFQVGDVRDPQGSSEAELGPKRRQRPIAQKPWGTLQGDCGGACLSCVAAFLIPHKNSFPTTALFFGIMSATHAPSFLSASFEIRTMLIKGAFLTYAESEVAVQEALVADCRARLSVM